MMDRSELEGVIAHELSHIKNRDMLLMTVAVVLAGFVADPTAGSMPGRRDVICGPAEPVYDSKQLGALAQATGTDESDWGYPVQPGLEVRATPQPTAPVVEKLGLQPSRAPCSGSSRRRGNSAT